MKHASQIVKEYFEKQHAELFAKLKEENSEERPDGHELAACSRAMREVEKILRRLEKKARG